MTLSWFLSAATSVGTVMNKFVCRIFMVPIIEALNWFTKILTPPGQNGRHFPDDIFKCVYWNENVLISIKIFTEVYSHGPISITPALVQIMAWRRPGEKPLSEPMLVSLLTHICVTRPPWVKFIYKYLMYHSIQDIYLYITNWMINFIYVISKEYFAFFV